MAETITMPKLGFDMAEGTLVRWVKKVGEDISKGDVLAEIETDKATVEVESSASGVVLQHIVDEGTIVPVNAAIAVVGARGENVQESAPPKAEAKPAAKAPAPTSQPGAQATSAPEAPRAANEGPIKASPLAKKIARDNQLNLSGVTGSGPGGRIVRKDVGRALAGGAATMRTAKPSVSGPVPPGVPVSHEDQTLPLSRLRQAIARRMTESTTSRPGSKAFQRMPATGESCAGWRRGSAPGRPLHAGDRLGERDAREGLPRRDRDGAPVGRDPERLRGRPRVHDADAASPTICEALIGYLRVGVNRITIPTAMEHPERRFGQTDGSRAGTLARGTGKKVSDPDHQPVCSDSRDRCHKLN